MQSLIRKAFFLGILMIFSTVTFVACFYLYRAFNDYYFFVEEEKQRHIQLENAEHQTSQYESYLNEVKGDPELMEQVIRKRLGYTRKDELVFKFESSKN